MPSWILWLSPVIVSPLLAVLWTSWMSRPRGPLAAIETVEEYDRFRAALTAPLAVPALPHQPRRRSAPRPKAPSVR